MEFAYLDDHEVNDHHQDEVNERITGAKFFVDGCACSRRKWSLDMNRERMHG